MIDNEQLFSKIVGMFRSYSNGDHFLNYDSSDVICGPNDRSMFGFDTNFPIEWLVEDFGFTKEEAKAFIDMVHLKDKGSIVEEMHLEEAVDKNTGECVNKKADMVEVVRCKNCIHNGEAEKCVLAAISAEKDFPLFILDDYGEWFCADGKPKKGANE